LASSNSVRDIALQIISQVNTGHGRARDILDRAIFEQKIVDPDKSFLVELVYGTIRWRGNLDWVLRQFIQPEKLKRLKPEILEILRLGLYQLLFLKSVPIYALVNESVKIAKRYDHEGVSGLVNAVLRNVARNKEKITYPDIQKDPIKHVSAKYSHPEWMITRWIDRYGIEETIKICSGNNLLAPLYIRTNLLKTSRDELIESLKAEGAEVVASQNLIESIKVLELPFALNQLSSYKSGWFQVQDESSMFASHILNPQPGEIVMDACAAPGGKTTHIAEIMQNRGKVSACDNDPRRLSLLSKACQRLGVTIVEITEADIRDLDKNNIKDGFDRILVDVPCTGLGVMRRRIEARWRRKPDDLKEFPKLQYDILSKVSHFLKPDGILVYCTCTTEPEENQQVVENFLKEHNEFQIEPINIPSLERIGAIRPEGYMQTYPHLHEMDGFFAAKLVKKAS